jgi:GTP cyclohydrolase I
MDEAKIKKATELLLEGIGEDVNREEIKKTPTRVAKLFCEFFSSSTLDPYKVFIPLPCGEDSLSHTISLDEINFYSLCEHHILPFFGKVKVIYKPYKLIAGFSKFCKLVDIFAHRLQTQERLTENIGRVINEVLSPKGLVVKVSAQHLCLALRGVKKEGVLITTFYRAGSFI